MRIAERAAQISFIPYYYRTIYTPSLAPNNSPIKKVAVRNILHFTLPNATPVNFYTKP
jgi:hypothetical protein